MPTQTFRVGDQTWSGQQQLPLVSGFEVRPPVQTGAAVSVSDANNMRGKVMVTAIYQTVVARCPAESMPLDVEHFERLNRLLDLERAEERARLRQDKAELPLAERESRGLTVLDLEATDSGWGLGGRARVTFVREGNRPLAARMGPGDVVEVSPRRAEVEAAPRALVVRSTRRLIELVFDRPPPDFVQDGRIRLDLIDNEVTWQRLKTAVAAMAARDRGQQRRVRDVLLGAAAPAFEKRQDFEPSRPLNPEQKDAVAFALSATDFALVHGPPGTGKSHVLAEVAVQAAAKGNKILCTAASNAAVDHLLELCVEAGLRSVRMGHPARVAAHLQQHTLDELVEQNADREVARELFDEAYGLMGYARKQRSQGRSRQRFSNARAAKTDAKALLDEARALERKAVAAELDRAQVICATLATALGDRLSGLEFQLALVDEATQATEPLTYSAFLRAPRVVLAGDPQQLAATVLSRAAAEGGLSKSLFERLLETHGEETKRMLKEQHRMPEALMRFPSREVYGGALRAHPAVANRTLAEVLTGQADAPPLLLLDTAGRGLEESTAPGSQSLRNEGEAQLVVRRARELLAAGLSPRALAVITPYRAQAALISELLQDEEELEVDTVDAFQGREKDAVLVSLVRSSSEGTLGFLLDLRRANVAFTRARRHLFVVGDFSTLAGNDFYRRFLDEAQNNGGYRSVWEWPAAEGL
jgi:ATP-dependent RNA/DNA helicase IGHMBP2